MRATAGTGRHHGLAVAVGALIVMVSFMSAALADAAPPSSTSSSTLGSTTSITSWPTDPVETADPPATNDPSLSPPTTPVTMTIPATITTVMHYPFETFDETDPPQPEDPAEQARSGGTPSLGSAERVAFRSTPATSDPAQPAEASPPLSTTTTEAARPASHTQDSAALAAATSPDGTESGVSLFWPVILGLCCLLLLGGPVVARRLRHPQ